MSIVGHLENIGKWNKRRCSITHSYPPSDGPGHALCCLLFFILIPLVYSCIYSYTVLKILKWGYSIYTLIPFCNLLIPTDYNTVHVVKQSSTVLSTVFLGRIVALQCYVSFCRTTACRSHVGTWAKQLLGWGNGKSKDTEILHMSKWRQVERADWIWGKWREAWWKSGKKWMPDMEVLVD